MKTRNGFVSNSSSTSYVFVIPDNFTLDSVDWDSVVHVLLEGEDPDGDDYMLTREQAIKSVKKFIDDGIIEGHHDDEYFMIDGKNISPAIVCDIIDEVIPKQFVVASFETGCDWRGARVVVTPESLQRKLDEIQKKPSE